MSGINTICKLWHMHLSVPPGLVPGSKRAFQSSSLMAIECWPDSGVATSWVSAWVRIYSWVRHSISSMYIYVYIYIHIYRYICICTNTHPTHDQLNATSWLSEWVSENSSLGTKSELWPMHLSVPTGLMHGSSGHFGFPCWRLLLEWVHGWELIHEYAAALLVYIYVYI